MSQFRQFWIKDFVVFKTHERYADGASVREAYDKPAPNRKIHVIEYAALEAAQKEIAELKDSNENIRSHLLSQTKISNQLLNEKEQLTAALKVAEDALLEVCKRSLSDVDWESDGKDYGVCSIALKKIEKIKKGLR